MAPQTKDCNVVASKLTFLLDDLLWVLTDSQLKAMMKYAESLSEAMEKSAQQRKSLAPEPVQVRDDWTSCGAGRQLASPDLCQCGGLKAYWLAYGGHWWWWCLRLSSFICCAHWLPPVCQMELVSKEGRRCGLPFLPLGLALSWRIDSRQVVSARFAGL